MVLSWCEGKGVEAFVEQTLCRWNGCAEEVFRLNWVLVQFEYAEGVG